MKPQPLTPTKLDKFATCARKFEAEDVTKIVPFQESDEIKYGNYLHGAFEKRLRDGKALPQDLEQHEPFLLGLTKKTGHSYAERQVALKIRKTPIAGSWLEPCGFFDKDVWWRGKIDYTKIDVDKALDFDWKTGKPHDKTQQLMQYAIWVLEAEPAVNVVHSFFYWTKTMTVTSYVLERKDMAEAWASLTPDIERYREAFRGNIWPPKPSGLCKSWCDVKGCEYHGVGARGR